MLGIKPVTEPVALEKPLLEPLVHIGPTHMQGRVEEMAEARMPADIEGRIMDRSKKQADRKWAEMDKERGTQNTGCPFDTQPSSGCYSWYIKPFTFWDQVT